MRGFVIRIFANAFGFWLAAKLIDGFTIDLDFGSVLLIALVFGVINALIKPIVQLLSLPLLILTVGLFSLVINALMLLLTDALLDSLHIATFWDALLAGLVISITGGIINGLLGD